MSLETHLDNAIIPLKIDISTGDVITPQAITYAYSLMCKSCNNDNGLQERRNIWFNKGTWRSEQVRTPCFTDVSKYLVQRGFVSEVSVQVILIPVQIEFVIVVVKFG